MIEEGQSSCLNRCVTHLQPNEMNWALRGIPCCETESSFPLAEIKMQLILVNSLMTNQCSVRRVNEFSPGLQRWQAYKSSRRKCLFIFQLQHHHSEVKGPLKSIEGAFYFLFFFSKMDLFWSLMCILCVYLLTVFPCIQSDFRVIIMHFIMSNTS